MVVEARDDARTAPAARRNVRLAIWDTYDYLKAKLNGEVTKSLETDRAILIKKNQPTKTHKKKTLLLGRVFFK